MNNTTPLPLVIVSHQLPEAWLAKLHGRCRIITGPPTTVEAGLSADLRTLLPQADGLFSLLTVRVDEALLAQAPRLRVVSNMAVGVDNIDLAACSRHGIPVGHTPGVLTDGTADLTLALLLAVARQLPTAAADAQAGKWTTWLPTGWLGADLQGATLGIVGLGKIGQAVARRAQGFGLRLLYSGPHEKAEAADLGATYVPLETLLCESDFVSLHAPLTTETRHLINAQTLRLMRPSAILINMARGPLVDTAALVDALQNGVIAAAGLDVTDPEPLPPSHPLYSLPNCLVVPHIGSATQHTRRRMAELACENLLAGLEGRPLPHQAN
ncbi:MAG: D-glycerate dehydrogenase [Ardenticatenaceae bacterium]|nr:D-glycerate dehydrogenase [Anaerolineales bacterium]MCB8923453.1 D-glycerate dehydrogenase [Ardenticatenaceae bacterium]MCB8991392.1 D-glycerate dehydrogenase [Ardenticatenaceae bacterium]MCB9003822.1 D-glycerate dehydrogenase [Ardenticatenaceae bacterium]